MKNLILSLAIFLVAQVAFGQWTITSLSTYKEAMGATVQPGSSNFWFAGGSETVLETDKVEIYNAETGTWTYSNLSEPRSFPVGAALDSLIFFAGGMNWLTFVPTSRVDIWHNNTASWSTAELSVPRFDMQIVAAAGKVLFAGGASLLANTNYDIIDVYDIATGQWSVTALPFGQSPAASAVVESENGPIAVFAGNTDINNNTVSDKVSIYHFNTDAWSFATLSEPRSFIASAVLGNKVFFAGGMKSDNTPSDRVDIFDATTGEWTTSQLSTPRGMFRYGASACGKVYIVGGGEIDLATNFVTSSSNVIDSYDPETGTWEIGSFSRELFFHTVLSDGDHLIIAGGRDFSASTLSKDVNVFTCPADAVEEGQKAVVQYRIYPNPSTGSFIIEKLGISPQKPALARVYNVLSELVYQLSLGPSDEKTEVNLAPGTYFLTIISDDMSQVEKVVIQ